MDQVKPTCWGIGFLCVLTITPVWAQPDFVVEKVTLSKEIENKNPKGIFLPHAYCEKDKNGQAAIPKVPTSQTSQVMFWTKIAAATTGKIRHSWHHQLNGVWTKISEVNMLVRPSSGYRMWSMKSLNPAIHRGDWMVVVAPSNKPDHILCIARFTVK